jgi:uncharacterized low-complexity protein
MKKLFLGLVTILALLAFTNFAVAKDNSKSTYTQTQSEDEKCGTGKCGGDDAKCAAGKCGGK